jgi:hypothetical protein
MDLNADYIPSPRLPPNPGPLTPIRPPMDLNADYTPSPRPPPGPESTSPLPTSQAPTDEPGPSNPSSSHGNTDLNHSLYQCQGLTDDSNR